MEVSELDIIGIISAAGQAKSCYIEAIQEAKCGDYEACNKLIREGNAMYAKGHRIHMQLVQEEAGGHPVTISLLLSHAQDQLLSADSFKILCDEFIDLYRRYDELRAKTERG